MNVAIIGAGFIGFKRAKAVIQQSSLKLVCDVDIKRAKELASKYDMPFCIDYNEVMSHNEIDIVIVATINQYLTPIMSEVVKILQNYPNVELIWASPRELYNVVQADSIGCHIITATNNILKKLPTLGKDLEQFSLETVKMFFDDATQAGYSI